MRSGLVLLWEEVLKSTFSPNTTTPQIQATKQQQKKKRDKVSWLFVQEIHANLTLWYSCPMYVCILDKFGSLFNSCYSKTCISSLQHHEKQSQDPTLLLPTLMFSSWAEHFHSKTWFSFPGHVTALYSWLWHLPETKWPDERRRVPWYSDAHICHPSLRTHGAQTLILLCKNRVVGSPGTTWNTRGGWHSPSQAAGSLAALQPHTVKTTT